MFKTCPKCKYKVIEQVQCSNCQLIFSVYLDQLKFKKFVKKKTIIDSPKVRVFAIPLMFILALGISNTFLKHLLIYFRVWAHEFGHAMMAWMSGVKATPLSFGNFGLTFHSDIERSMFVFVCFFFLMSALYAYGKKEQSSFLSSFSFILCLLSIFFTWISPESKVEELIVFGGFAGEMILASLFVFAFSYNFPQRWYWQSFTRWPFLFLGFFILIVSTQDWMDAYQVKSLSPFGINYSAEFGDLNRLMQNYQWSYRKFIRIYLGISVICWSIIVGSYLYPLRNIRLKT